MSIQSMTGFARQSGHITLNPNEMEAASEAEYAIELRSVNGKGLETRLRLPNSLEALEQEIKKHIASVLKRGNITANITLKTPDNRTNQVLNEAAFKDILNAAKKAAKISGLPLPSLDALLNIRSVIQEEEQSEPENNEKALHAHIMQAVKEATETLAQARKEEGEKLNIVLRERLDQIQNLLTQAKTESSNQLPFLKQKIKENLAKLIEQNEELDENRLHQEAILLSVKADISEELDRLNAHVKQAHELLSRDEPIGRRLDFLCQEFNREANTMCSKAHSKEITYIGLELKTVIDQLREQVQNIE